VFGLCWVWSVRFGTWSVRVGSGEVRSGRVVSCRFRVLPGRVMSGYWSGSAQVQGQGQGLCWVVLG
jgi:hypothetical protein